MTPNGPLNAGELLEAFAQASDDLFAAGVTRSDSFTGEIGEFVASRTLGLTLVDRSTAAIDAVRGGRGYQIKSVSSTNRRAAIPVPHLTPGFDVLVGVRLTDRYEPVEVIEIDGDDVPPNVRVLSESLFAIVPCRRHTTFPRQVLEVAGLLTTFAAAYEALIANAVIRTRHVVGDVGAGYAATTLGLELVDDPTNAGYDAVDRAGRTYEIKTRRVYDSGRRISDTRRINGLVGKTADVMVVVALDRSFRCSGMWTMPVENVINPKSANMTNILLTPGIRRIR